MKLVDVLRLLTNHLPDRWVDDDDERLREAEQRVNALDATIGAQQAQRARERDRRDRREREGHRAIR